jgi:hypothetical protein
MAADNIVITNVALAKNIVATSEKLKLQVFAYISREESRHLSFSLDSSKRKSNDARCSALEFRLANEQSKIRG